MKTTYKKLEKYKQPSRKMINRHYQAFSQKQKTIMAKTYEEMLSLSGHQEIGKSRS